MCKQRADNSPLTGPLRPGGGLRASTRLGLGGFVWLVCCFAFFVWLQPGPVPPGSALNGVHVSTRPSAALQEEKGAAEERAALVRLDALVERALPLALPLARWSLESVDATPSGDPQAWSGEAGEAQNPPPRCYTITGSCAPLRLSLTLLESPGALEPAHAEAETAQSLRPQAVWTERGELELRLNGRVRYIFRFPGREAALADLARPLPKPALILVIDDLGQHLEPAEMLAALPFPVSFAIWPLSPKAGETAALAAQRRLDCLVHLPMEALPRAGGFRPGPGPGALRVDMDAQTMSAVLEKDLKALPTAVGLNNHMGSRFTGSAEACRRFCALLAGRGLFVLDSVTRPAALLEREARAAGLVSASRSVFLDTRRDVPAISAALDDAAAKARRQGFAVAIGHPYPETLRALRRWQDKEGVAIVPLRRLIWHLAQTGAASANRSQNE